MRNFAKYYILFAISALLLCTSKVEAQNYERLSEYEQNLYGESAYVNGDYETMKNIRAFWVKECNKLKNRNCEFVLCGNAEAILKVTIPARVLFQQADTILSQQADQILRPLFRFVSGAEAYATCIIACHSDNNGSDKYLSSITTSRAASLYRYMAKQGVPANALSYYGHGNKVYRNNNENIRNRERNRRVTLYFVPNKKMLKAAKKGKI